MKSKRSSLFLKPITRLELKKFNLANLNKSIQYGNRYIHNEWLTPNLREDSLEDLSESEYSEASKESVYRNNDNSQVFINPKTP